MSRRVFAWDANVLVDSRLYNLSDKRAEEELSRGVAMRIFLPDGRWALRLIPKREEIIPGFNNLVPFGRVYNPMLHPPGLHYEVPRAGDHGLFRRHFRKLVRVSRRKIDFTSSQYRIRAAQTA